MKTVTKSPWFNGAAQVLSRLRWAHFCVVAVLLAFNSTAIAQLSVVTVGGGPTNINANASYSGYADGSTLQVAQFNLPTGLALDSASRYLYVADTGNNAVRKVDLSGGTTSTLINGLNAPVDVAVDASTNIFILTKGDGKITKIDIFGNVTSPVNTTVLTAPNALALDPNGIIYVIEAGGSLKKVNPTGGAVTLLVGPGTFSAPLGIEVMDTGTIVVSDTGNHVIRLVNPNTFAVSILSGAVGVTGTNNGPSAVARFNGPRGIAKAGNNTLIVADYGNNQVRQIDVSSGTTTYLYGVPTAVWSGLPEGYPYYPGWADGNATQAEVRSPAGVVVDGAGNVYDSEQFYHILRKATGTGLTGPGGTTSSGTNVVLNPPSLTFTPNTGYFPMGQTITVTSSSTNVFYTTDGTTPTTNSIPVVMNGGVGTIIWSNPTNDLTRLQVTAFITSGTNSASTNLTGVVATANTVGIPPSINTNLQAGIGSVVVVPVVANMRPTDTVKSFQFRVEITPNGGAPAVGNQFQALNIGSNDFVKVTTAAQGSSAATFTATPYTIPPNTTGLAISALGTNSSVSFQRFAVVAMLAVPIPGTALEGQTYTISVNHVSATSDGQQTSVPITANADITLTVTNIAYLVGDTSPGRWYNAGDFGNGDLANNDVNNVFSASLGFAVPYSFTDVFNAMDAYPEDQPGVANAGDGLIRYLDLQVILNRSLRLPPYTGGNGNWMRALSTNGDRTNNVATIAANSPVTKLASIPPGSVWNRQVTIGALPVGNLQPGNTVSMPVYLKVAGGSSLGGFQFRAIVDAKDSAPALTNQVQFTVANGIANPVVTTDSTFINQVGCTWNLGAVSFASQSSNLVGYVTFRIPGNAVVGQSYLLHFANADGSPVPAAQYDFDTISATANVGVAAAAPHKLSDDWVIHFFGTLDNPQADPNADPDGDGIPNWQEYLAGTDPTSASSQLVLDVVVVTSPNGVSIKWLSAPGKTYVLESTPSLINPVWTTETTVIGDGNNKEISEPNNNDGTKFYRVRLVP